MLKYFMGAALALLASAATAQPRPPDTPPATVELPTDLATALRQYLGRQPHDDVVTLINGMTACFQAQIPQGGAIQDRGQCPAVTAARAARTKPE